MLSRLPLALCALALGFTAAPLHADAPAPAAAEAAIPLIVVRFTQPHVYFDSVLCEAVTRALETKKDTMFDVVLRPGFRSDASGENLSHVVTSLYKAGVPQGQLTSATGDPSGERWDVIDIYVR